MAVISFKLTNLKTFYFYSVIDVCNEQSIDRCKGNFIVHLIFLLFTYDNY